MLVGGGDGAGAGAGAGEGEGEGLLLPCKALRRSSDIEVTSSVSRIPWGVYPSKTRPRRPDACGAVDMILC